MHDHKNQCKNIPSYDSKLILKDIFALKDLFSEFFIMYVSRQANQATDFFTAHARKGDFIFYKDMDIPFQLAAVLWRDIKGIGSTSNDSR